MRVRTAHATADGQPTLTARQVRQLLQRAVEHCGALPSWTAHRWSTELDVPPDATVEEVCAVLSGCVGSLDGAALVPPRIARLVLMEAHRRRVRVSCDSRMVAVCSRRSRRGEQ